MWNPFKQEHYVHVYVCLDLLIVWFNDHDNHYRAHSLSACWIIVYEIMLMITTSIIIICDYSCHLYYHWLASNWVCVYIYIYNIEYIISNIIPHYTTLCLCHVISRHIIWYHSTSYDIISNYNSLICMLLLLHYDDIKYDILSYFEMSNTMLWHHIALYYIKLPRITLYHMKNYTIQ